MKFEDFIHITTKVMEFLGIAVIVGGAFFASFLYLKCSLKNDDSGYDQLRKSLGRSILLGLEFLVAADIINTVAIEPTMKSVSVLGLIVIIRTFLSFSIEVELERKLPWVK